ncbi:MAG: hypothetical protein KGO82_12190 [Bacteroidota bacterium]|nr:hypothetical protein [Bacteroidota bacterium]
MLKKMLVLIAAIPVVAFSQKKGSAYFMPTAGAFKFSNVDAQAQGSFSVGANIRYLSLGVGAGYTRFPKDKYDYIPVFGEIIFTIPESKVGPFLSARFGKGIYSGPVDGAGYFEAKAGLAIGKGKSKLVLSGGLVNSSFKTKPIYPAFTTTTSTSHGFSITVGFKI